MARLDLSIYRERMVVDWTEAKIMVSLTMAQGIASVLLENIPNLLLVFSHQADILSYLSKEKRISGDELLELALDIIYQAKYLLGGVIEFLECEDNEALMNFYERNGFRFFNSRVTQGESPHKLNQLLKFIR